MNINMCDLIHTNMAKWKKNETEFRVSITENKSCGTSYSYIPKPILEELGNPIKLMFKKSKGQIVVKSGDD